MCSQALSDVNISSVLSSFSCCDKCIIIMCMRLCVSQVEGIFYVNSHLENLMMDELRHSCQSKGKLI